MSVLYIKDGDEWQPITTIKGERGEQGPIGPQGPEGPQGPAGPQGPEGGVSAEEFEDLAGEVATLEADKANTDLSNLTEEGEDKLKQLSFPYVGQTIFSLDPLVEDTLHLLDGTVLPVGGIYDQFVTEYIANLYTTHPQRFCTETEWQNSVTTYGVCGKYVYNAGVSVRLPKVTGFVEGTIDPSVLGEITEAGLPTLTTNSTGEHTHSRGTMNITGQFKMWGLAYESSGALTASDTGSTDGISYTGAGGKRSLVQLNASNNWTGATSSAGAHTHTIAGTSSTVQPQSIKGFIYIVVATGSKTDIEVDLDNIATDLNSLATNKVSKSGDTMTGALHIKGQLGIPLQLTNMNVTDSTIPATSNMYYGIQFNDAKGNRIGRVEGAWYTDGTTSFGLNANRTVNGTAKYCAITCKVDTAGNGVTSAPTPAAGDNSTKIATTAYCVNRRCTTKPTTTSTASVTRPCWVVQNYLNGTSWYRVWSDGFIEQGGYQSSATGSVGLTITFLKPFSNTNYTVVATVTGAERYFVSCLNKAAGSFFWRSFNEGGQGYDRAGNWYACGY